MAARQYEASRMLMQLTCNNCHKQVTIDPQDPDDVASTKDWIMIVPSTGEKIGVCSKDCGVKTVHKLPEVPYPASGRIVTA